MLKAMADTTVEQMQARAAEWQAEQQKRQAVLQRQNYYKSTLSYGLGMAGNVAGIIVAVKRKSGFLGGVGWFLVLGLAGGAAGYVIGSVVDGKPSVN